MLQDTETWQDPENFRPERHLDADGKLVKSEAFTPFGIGIIFRREILQTQIILTLF
jgi:cytochrome P450